MRRVRKFLSLPSAERSLIIQAAFLLYGARVGLWLLPFSVLRAWVDRVKMRTLSANSKPHSPSQIAWAVETTSRYLPLTRRCFPKALAVQVLLARSGYSSRIQIGVTRDKTKGFLSHAWVEIQGQVLIGEGEGAVFAPILSLGSTHR